MPQILVTCLVFTVVQSQPGLTGPTGLCVRCWSRLWFMLWLSVRWRITSEFSWASVECDRLTRASPGRGVYTAYRALFLFEENLFVSDITFELDSSFYASDFFSPFLLIILSKCSFFQWDRPLFPHLRHTQSFCSSRGNSTNPIQ